MTADPVAAVLADIRAEVEDYCRVFPTPYGLSPVLTLAVRAGELLPPAPLLEILAETQFGETYRRWATDWEPADGVNRADGDGRAVL